MQLEVKQAKFAWIEQKEKKAKTATVGVLAESNK